MQEFLSVWEKNQNCHCPGQGVLKINLHVCTGRQNFTFKHNINNTANDVSIFKERYRHIGVTGTDQVLYKNSAGYSKSPKS